LPHKGRRKKKNMGNLFRGQEVKKGYNKKSRWQEKGRGNHIASSQGRGGRAGKRTLQKQMNERRRKRQPPILLRNKGTSKIGERKSNSFPKGRGPDS